MEWISVKDRLPDEGVQVLTIDISKNWHDYRLDYIVKFPNDPNEPYIWACRLIDEYNKVTHWMQLPPPPRDEYGMD